MHISLAAEKLFEIGTFPVTNTLLISLSITVFLSVIALFVSRTVSWQPGMLQNGAELVLDGILNFFDTVTEDRHLSEKFIPLVVTIFLVVLCSNLIEIVPGLGTIGLIKVTQEGKEFIPFLRSASADLNFTLAIALSAIIGVQILGIGAVGFFQHWKKFFFPPWEKPYLVGTFIGLLELIAEVARVISFSFRLFGNIFAGEVLLTVVLFLAPYIAPLPFLFLEVFVGMIQAIVFSMLTLVFLKVATAHAEH